MKLHFKIRTKLVAFKMDFFNLLVIRRILVSIPWLVFRENMTHMPLCFLASHILKCPHSIMINDLTRAFEQLMVRKRISISRALKRWWGAATQKSVQIFHEIHSAFRRRNYHPHNEAKANMWWINFGQPSLLDYA